MTTDQVKTITFLILFIKTLFLSKAPTETTKMQNSREAEKTRISSHFKHLIPSSPAGVTPSCQAPIVAEPLMLCSLIVTVCSDVQILSWVCVLTGWRRMCFGGITSTGCLWSSSRLSSRRWQPTSSSSSSRTAGRAGTVFHLTTSS